ncbi:MAG: TonB-dependent receptor plug domain-containing protein, partial [Bacteroidota bacterium]
MKNLYLLILASCFFSMSMAQTGTLRGKLTDENGLGLPGASVFIESLGKGVISDVEGNYVMLNIESGQHEVLVEFIGYADFSSTVDIAAGQTTIFNAELNPGITIGEEVLVLGDRLKGQAKALNQQKNNINITNIVAADQIGRFPDANIGDAIKRVSGITIQADQGEARNIIVRGLAPQLNSVTLNGDRIPSAEGDNRNIQLDLIPADMVQTIEVNKAVTPDMEGDAIGGSVNLITRPAPSDLRVSATLASGMNLITNKPTFVGSFIVGDRFANDRIGLIVSSSLNFQDFGSDNVEAEWENEVESPLSGEDISVAPWIGEQDIRTYLVRRF